MGYFVSFSNEMVKRERGFKKFFSFFHVFFITFLFIKKHKKVRKKTQKSFLNKKNFYIM
jgi:hypothetical protein